jgi:ribosome-associated protein
MTHDEFDEEQDFEALPTGPSKSEKKRAAQDRQSLIARILELAPSEWQRLGFDESARKAMLEGKRIKASGARNRQIKYLARILDDAPLQAGATFLDNRHSQQLEANRVFHALERWRDRLVAEGTDAMGALLDEYPDIDRQQLRQLILGARHEHDTGKPAGAGKKLFRFLREQTLG